MSLGRIRIYVSALSDQIMIGRIGKREGIALDRRDATSEFIAALMDWNPPGTVRTISDGKGNSYEIKVRKVKQQSKQESRDA